MPIKDLYENSWALIIGIDKYKNVQNLDYAVADAKSIQATIIDKFGFPEENVRLMSDDEATYLNIRNALFEVSKSAGAKDRILIFFAGHGQTEDLPDGGEMGYILPVDGDLNNLFSTAIPMDDFKKISSMSNARHILFLVDACYGGLAAVGFRGLSLTTPNYINKIIKYKSRQIITAGGRGEQVIEKSEWGHSVFTMNVLRGLEDNRADTNSDGFITVEELGLFLKEKVTVDSEGQQTPQSRRFTSHEGEFVFVHQTNNNLKSQQLDKSIQVRQSNRGNVVEIPQAFKSGTTQMNYHTTQVLNEIVIYIKSNPFRQVIVESHTDNDLPAGYSSMLYNDNWKLSMARADEIVNYFLFKGINPEKMISLGYAEFWPYGISWDEVRSGLLTESIIDSLNQNTELRSKNRRIKIIVANTNKEYKETTQSIKYYQQLVGTYLKKNPASFISYESESKSYKLIIFKSENQFQSTISFPPIVGPDTGHLLASIPYFIMQAPSDKERIARWGENIGDLENRLSTFETKSFSGDSLTLYWGELGEYYFKFYVQ